MYDTSNHSRGQHAGSAPHTAANALARRLGANADRELSGHGYTGEVRDTLPAPTVCLDIQFASARKADAILAILNSPE